MYFQAKVEHFHAIGLVVWQKEILLQFQWSNIVIFFIGYMLSHMNMEWLSPRVGLNFIQFSFIPLVTHTSYILFGSFQCCF